MRNMEIGVFYVFKITLLHTDLLTVAIDFSSNEIALRLQYENSVNVFKLFIFEEVLFYRSGISRDAWFKWYGFCSIEISIRFHSYSYVTKSIT